MNKLALALTIVGGINWGWWLCSALTWWPGSLAAAPRWAAASYTVWWLWRPCGASGSWCGSGEKKWRDKEKKRKGRGRGLFSFAGKFSGSG